MLSFLFSFRQEEKKHKKPRRGSRTVLENQENQEETRIKTSIGGPRRVKRLRNKDVDREQRCRTRRTKKVKPRLRKVLDDQENQETKTRSSIGGPRGDKRLRNKDVHQEQHWRTKKPNNLRPRSKTALED
ncbi:hypothetical protein SRHO_G00146970 [Serrasalmus rhombeus]